MALVRFNPLCDNEKKYTYIYIYTHTHTHTHTQTHTHIYIYIYIYIFFFHFVEINIFSNFFIWFFFYFLEVMGSWSWIWSFACSLEHLKSLSFICSKPPEHLIFVFHNTSMITILNYVQFGEEKNCTFNFENYFTVTKRHQKSKKEQQSAVLN